MHGFHSESDFVIGIGYERGPRIHLTVMEVMPIVMRVAPVTTTQAVDMVSITVGPMDLAPVTVPATQLTTTTILGPAILHTRNS